MLSANFTSTSANASGRSFRGHGCGICCPGSGFLGPRSSGTIAAAVHSIAVLFGTFAWVQVPIQSRSTAGPPSERPMAAMSALRHALGPGSAASTTPGHSFHQLRWWGRELRSSLLDRGTLLFDARTLLFVCVNSNQRVYLSGGLRVLRCAHAGLQDL